MALWAKISIDRNPLRTRGEEFFLGIEGDDVGAQGADATVGAKGDFGDQAGVVFVESFESRDQAFAAEVFAAEFEGMDQYSRGRNRRGLRCCMRRGELVPL